MKMTLSIMGFLFISLNAGGSYANSAVDRCYSGNFNVDRYIDCMMLRAQVQAEKDKREVEKQRLEEAAQNRDEVRDILLDLLDMTNDATDDASDDATKDATNDATDDASDDANDTPIAGASDILECAIDDIRVECQSDEEREEIELWYERMALVWACSRMDMPEGHHCELDENGNGVAVPDTFLSPVDEEETDYSLQDQCLVADVPEGMDCLVIEGRIVFVDTSLSAIRSVEPFSHHTCRELSLKTLSENQSIQVNEDGTCSVVNVGLDNFDGDRRLPPLPRTRVPIERSNMESIIVPITE